MDKVSSNFSDSSYVNHPTVSDSKEFDQVASSSTDNLMPACNESGSVSETVPDSVESRPKDHHIKQELCTTRPPYRDGRQLKAVKVYTVSQESKYLLVLQIPSVGAIPELIQLFALYGTIEEYRILDDYPAPEPFTDVMWIKFQRIVSARFAKKKMDNYNFYGGSLHVCYAPEYESVEDTRQKLIGRRRDVARRLHLIAAEKSGVPMSSQQKRKSIHGHSGKSHQALYHTTESTKHDDSADTESKPLQGPSLPVAEERKRKHFHLSETGDSSYDHTVGSVRQVVSKYSTSLLPRQLKRIKKS